MRRSGSRVLASSRAPQAEPLVHVGVGDCCDLLSILKNLISN